MRTAPGLATEGESSQAEHRIGAIKGANRRMRDVRVRKDTCACFGAMDSKLDMEGHGGTRVGLGMKSKKEGAVEANLRPQEPEAWKGVHLRGTRHRV